ncbi:MAG: threonyl-tRNA synthetase editing domain-containing protein [Promethearchaeota archaeon]
MRFLSFHCDYFRYTTTKRSRSKVFEELTDKNKEGSLENPIVFFISIEKQDEMDDKILQKCILEIEKITTQLKVSNIVLLSFAHLFGELSSPEFGLSTLKNMETLLINKFERILRPPFGWFNELELKAKGHPLSRISRKIN